MADPWSVGRAQVAERGDVTVQILRLRSPEPALLARLGRILGAEPPCEPNVAAGQAPRIFWLAPGEWALAGEAPPDLAARIAAACGETLHHLCDLMASWTAFHVAGEGAATLLAKGCSLDLHPAAFGPDRCARTLLAQVPVLIARTDAGFAVYADRSLAAHLRTWFAAARALDPPPNS